MVGAFAAVLVVAFAIYSFTTHAPTSAGVPAGRQLHFFAAPLAASTLNGDANLNPPCTLARHNPGALNVCLLVKRGPLGQRLRPSGRFFALDARFAERTFVILREIQVPEGL